MREKGSLPSSHRVFVLLVCLLCFLTTTANAQKPAFVLEVDEADPERMTPARRGGGATSLRWENLKFVFTGPEQITRDVVTEAQVTVFDLTSHRIVFQTEIYQVSGRALEPGPNYTAFIHLSLLGNNGRTYRVLVGSGLIELVVPLEPVVPFRSDGSDRSSKSPIPSPSLPL